MKLQFQKRKFYFQSLQSNLRNTEFPLNLGYNDNFKYHNQYPGSRLQRLQVWLRKKPLHLLFERHYKDLLGAIVSNNYEQLELLCEQNLTLAIAAGVYDVTKMKKQKFKVLNMDQKVECEIINHFMIQNVMLDRSQNRQSISKYNIINKNGNCVYQERVDTAEKSYDTLEKLMALKKLYYKEGNGVEDFEIVKEIDRFQKNKLYSQEVEKEFRQTMQLEYELIQAYQPAKLSLLVEEKQQTKVKVDLSRISEKGYLEKLAEQQEQSKFQVISMTEYAERELEKSDLFLFMKNCAHYQYEQFSGKPTQEVIKTNLFGKKQNCIEIFDVLVKGKTRLCIVDNNGVDILDCEEYKQNLQLRKKISDREQQVYDTSQELVLQDYLVSHPDYQQIHCLRFEIQRHPKENLFKLTDVDFFLDGNRHLKLVK